MVRALATAIFLVLPMMAATAGAQDTELQPNIIPPIGHEQALPGHLHGVPGSECCPDCTPGFSTHWYMRGEFLGLQSERWEGGRFVIQNGVSRLSLNDLDGDFEWGGRLYAGFRVNDCTEFQDNIEYEIGGFGVVDMNSGKAISGTNNLNLPVFNHLAGFEDFGVNVSFLDIENDTQVAGFDVICRTWICKSCSDACSSCGTNPCNTCNTCDSCNVHSILPVDVSIECGLRYLNVNDKFTVFSQLGATRAQSGLQDFFYRIQAQNHIIGPQLGVVLETPDWYGFDMELRARGLFGLNITDNDVTLRELTGNVAFEENQDGSSFAQSIDFGSYLRWKPCSGMQVRLGYQFLWINGLALGPDMFESNVADAGYDDDNGILLHGPSFGLEYQF